MHLARTPACRRTSGEQRGTARARRSRRSRRCSRIPRCSPTACPHGRVVAPSVPFARARGIFGRSVSDYLPRTGDLDTRRSPAKCHGGIKHCLPIGAARTRYRRVIYNAARHRYLCTFFPQFFLLLLDLRLLFLPHSLVHSVCRALRRDRRSRAHRATRKQRARPLNPVVLSSGQPGSEGIDVAIRRNLRTCRGMRLSLVPRCISFEIEGVPMRHPR